MKPDIRILIVDDDDMMAELIEDTIGDMDYKSDHASYGSQALLALQSPRKYDMMITDLEMPGMGGERLIDEVVLHYKDLPIVVLSGSVADRKKREELFKKGVCEVLEKPVPIAELENAIRRHIQEVPFGRASSLAAG